MRAKQAVPKKQSYKLNGRCPMTLSEQRAQEKEASRKADEEAVASGKMTPRDIEKKNLFLDPAKTIVHWNRSGKL